MRARLALIALGLAAPSAAAAQTVVAFGDSWAFDTAPELQAALTAAGHPTVVVANHAVSGSTAQQWAADPSTLRNAVAAYPDTAWVYLSAGGNDIIEAIAAGQGAMAAQRNDTNLRAILDQLFVTHPDVRVVMFGYDYTNFEQSAFCQSQITQLFGANATQASVNQRNVAEVGQVMQAVAAAYPNVTYVPLWGTLQAAVGQPDDPGQPSPASLMRDCYHPNSAGARALMDALVAGYWSATAPPTVALTPSAPAGCDGDTVTVTAATARATRLTWWIDGQAAGSANPLAVPLAAPGPVSVDARADNAVWSAQDSLQLTVDPCLDAGFPDAGVEPDVGFPDAGFPDSGVEPDAGFPDSGVEPDVGFVDAGARPDAGFYDGGVATDAASDLDASAGDAGPRPDGGVAPLDAGRVDDDIFNADGDDLSIRAGCRDAAPPRDAPLGLGPVALLALAAARRRR